MVAAELDSAELGKRTVTEMLKRRILINCTSDTVLRFLPPFILERAHVDTAIAALDEIFTEYAAGAGCSGIRRRTPTWLAERQWNAGTVKSPVEKDPDVLAAAARLAGEDMCSIADLSSAEVRAILKLGHDVKRNPREYRHALDAKQMVLMFEKASLRTRLAFETGINTMGGNAIFVDQTSSPLGEREAIADVARNVERWVDVIVLRTYAHDTITEMAANSRVPVINALSDFEHPCQALADFMTLEEHFGSVAGLNFTYVGDGNNVCHSLMLTGAQLGANVTVGTPRGYSPDIEIVTQAREMAAGQRLRGAPAAGPAGRSRGRGRHLHRCVREHGLRARVHQARAHLPAVPGERSVDAEGRAARGLHALPAGAPQRGSDGCGARQPAVDCVRPGRKPDACAEGAAAVAARRSGECSEFQWAGTEGLAELLVDRFVFHKHFE